MNTKLSQYLQLKKEFPTDCGEYKCFLFIDGKLMLNFLKSLPKKNLLNLRVGYDNKLIDQFNEEFNFLLRELLEIENKVDNIDSNEEYYQLELNQLEKNILILFYNKSINSQNDQKVIFINFYVYIYIFEHINTKIRNWLYEEISIIYYNILSFEEKSLLRNISNRWILDYNNLINNDIINRNYYIINRDNIYNSNKQEFITIIGDSLTFLFIDESLIISFLKSLPEIKENYYEIEMGRKIRGYGKDEWNIIIEWESSDYSNNYDILIDIVSNKTNYWDNDFIIKWYPKICYWFINIDISVDIKLVNNLYEKITNLYYYNMTSEERALLRTVKNDKVEDWYKRINKIKK